MRACVRTLVDVGAYNASVQLVFDYKRNIKFAAENERKRNCRINVIFNRKC